MTNTVYPLLLQGLWVQHQQAPQSVASHTAIAMCILSAVDLPALRQAFQAVVDRHPVLRSIFLSQDGQLVQQIQETQSVVFAQIDAAGWDEQRLRAEVLAAHRRPYDLSHGPLFRVDLFTLAADEHVLLIGAHQMILDQQSLWQLLSEVSLLLEGQVTELPPLDRTYIDLIAWQNEMLERKGEQLRGYWQSQLAHVPPLLELPTDYVRPSAPQLDGATEFFSLSPELTQALNKLALTCDVTLYMVLLATFQVLLHRYSGQEELVVGTVTPLDRSAVAAEGELPLGYFSNLIPLRADLADNPTFSFFLNQVRQTVSDGLTHQAYPFPLLVQQLDLPHSANVSPLVQVLFNYLTLSPKLAPFFITVPGEEQSRRSIYWGGLLIAPFGLPQQEGGFDLILEMVEGASASGREGERALAPSLFGALKYNTALFKPDTIQRMMGHFQTLLASIASNPEQRIADLPLLTEAEREQLLVEWNDTQADYPSDKCIHQLFEEQVERTPEAIAVIFGDQQLSYRELNHRANQLAHYLMGLKVGPDVLVGLCVERSIEMMVGLLGILKAGGACVPLDPTYPHERLQFMLSDAKVKVLLTDDNGYATLSDHSAVHLARIPATQKANPKRNDDPANLVYILYTSGSTGKPKGVAMPHRALCNLIDWQRLMSDGTGRTLQFAPMNFDISWQEVFATLCVGGTLVLINQEKRYSPFALLAYLKEQAINRLFLPFTPLQQLAEVAEGEMPATLREVIQCGEPLRITPAIADWFRDSQCVLHNHYGPTESHVVTAYTLADEVDDSPRWRGASTLPPIGRPITNTQIYILDRHQNPVPIGIPGELYIGGVGVARGYLNRSQLTKEKFIPNPYGSGRLYKTGDLCRYLPDGNIEFLGRIDHQVKVRGFRIELGEIEVLLNQHPNVREAVVVVRDTSARSPLPELGEGLGVRADRLVAYLVGESASSSTLRAYLAEKLPDYMIPSAFVQLEALPLTPNGKINRRALPAPDYTPDKRQLVLPRTPNEQLLATIWQEVLSVERVGIYDNFFELGGHSLLATKVISRIRQALQAELPLRQLFECPTIAQLAGQLRRGSTVLPPIQPADRPSPLTPLLTPPASGQALGEGNRSSKLLIPLSFAQERLWFLAQLEGVSATYNMPAAWHLDGAVDHAALEWSLNEIAQRHEALRTTFSQKDGQAYQIIAPATFSLSLVTLEAYPSSHQEAEVERLVSQAANEPFDLSKGPLWRVSLLRLSAERHVLLLTMHHIISDGWSMGVFARELSALYAAYTSGQASPLARLDIQYADFALWQRAWLTGKVDEANDALPSEEHEILEKQLAYWKKQLADAPALLDLPTDHPRPAVQSYRGGHYVSSLPLELTSTLKQVSQQMGTTLFMTLQAAFAVLLSRYSTSDDILIGTPIANRQQAELEDLIGFFVNTLVLRTDLSGNPTFSQLLKQVRQVALEAYQQQDLPFERLVDSLQPERTMSYNPLFQVMFVLQIQNTPQEQLSLAGVVGTPLEVAVSSAKFDLTLSMEECESGLTGLWEYSTELFEPATIERMAGHFQRLLEGIVANSEQRVSELPLLTPPEHEQLLVEWNNTPADYAFVTCIHHLFEEQAERTPEAPAVVFENKQISYRELNSRANQLAHHLIGLGVGPEALVGICIERSIEMVVALLGVLKAGGAYVPVDPTYPEERRNFMLSDSGVEVLLTQSKFVEAFDAGLNVLCLDQDEAETPLLRGAGGVSLFPFGENKANPQISVRPDNLVYCVYTSGSTGRPKGVLVEHQSLCNLILAQIPLFEVQPDSHFLQFVSFSFDVATSEIFMALCCGAALYLASTGHSVGLGSLIDELEQQAITHIELPPTVLAALPYRDLPRLRTIVVGGEACPPEVIAQWSEGRNFFNGYGPTETTICATIAKLTPRDVESKSPSIGRVIPNIQIYILDEYLQPVPIGVPGELYIGGAGVTRGYLNRPQLTKETFINAPLSLGRGAGDRRKEGRGRIYKTGDLCRYRPDGNIEFLGRIDHQVKIRSFRIELGEIETLLSQHPKVQQAVVIVREEALSGKQLVAYVVDKEAVSNDELRGYLASQLPAYMRPSAFVQLDALPLTPNGKVDRRNLPAPQAVRQAHEAETKIEGAGTPTEALLALIWAELLTVEQVGIHDNFFELGGDSILSLQIISRAKQAGLHLTPKQLFQHQTIAELASVATLRLSEPTSQSEQGIVTGLLPLTPVQQWFLEQQWQEPHHFNQSFLLEVKPDLSPILLREAVAHLLRHHDALRLRASSVTSGDAQSWLQTLRAPRESVPFEVVDLSALSSEEQPTALERKANQLQASLSLSEGPLLRVALFRCTGVDKLLIVIHHLAVDGVSWRILLEDLQTAYQQLVSGERIELPAKTTSFKAWATLLKEQGPIVVANELAYWRSIGTTSRSSPLTPREALGEGDYENNIASTANVSCFLSHSQTQLLLKEVPAVYNTQINDLLLTALLLAFRAWTGESTLRLDLEGHGREALFDGVDLSRTVGWFTTIFPVHLEVESNLNDPAGVIKSVKEQLRQIPNRGIGYGILRYLSDSELPEQPAQVSFNYYGQFDQMSNGPLLLGLAPNPSLEHSPQGTRPYLLDINGMVVEGRLQVDWTYSQNYHQRERIEQLANHFIDALGSLIAHCQSPEAGGYTPSDFPEAALSQQELDDLLSGRRARIEAIYPLSPMQEGMLFHTLYAPHSGVYVEQMAVAIEPSSLGGHLSSEVGRLDVSAFKQAWRQVVARHAVLRTEFVGEQRQKPLQVVLQEVDLPWHEQDWRLNQEPEKALDAYLAAERQQGFDLHKAPLMRFALMRVADDTYYFVWTFHHLLLDGWSTPLLLQEVEFFYTTSLDKSEAARHGLSRHESRVTSHESRVTSHQSPTTIYLERPRAYKDYITWLQQQDLVQAERYWQQALQGFTAPTPLVVDRTSSSASEGAYSDHDFHLSPAVTDSLSQLARENRLTFNTLVQGVWALLLSRYSREADVLFGATVSGRPAELRGVETMIGLFINTLPVRVNIPADGQLLPWLQKLQQEQLEREQYAYTPLVEIQAWSGVPASMPLFESLLVFENYPVVDQQTGLFNTSLRSVEQTNYPLTVVAELLNQQEEGAQLRVGISYDTSRFDAPRLRGDETIGRMAGHLQTLFEAIAANPEQPIAHLPLLTEQERHQLLVEWNDSQADYPSGKCFHQLFEEQVARTPEAIAVVFENQQLTYRELNARANDLAHILGASGVEAEKVVGLLGERNIEFLVGMLAIFKAGGVYLPLDPFLPAQRLSHIIKQSQATLILASKAVEQGLFATLAWREIKGLEQGLREIKGLEHGLREIKGLEQGLREIKGLEHGLREIKGLEQAARGIKGLEQAEREMTRGEVSVLWLDDLPVSTLNVAPPFSDVAFQASDNPSYPSISRHASVAIDPCSTLRSGPDSLAYVIFTSGSTGLPKGAMVEHKGMLNHLYAKCLDLNLTSADIVAQNAPQSFDISVWQFLSALLVGGRVHIFNDEVARDPERLLAEVATNEITILEVVPSLLRVMLESNLKHDPSAGSGQRLSKLRWLVPTGEALPPQLARQWFERYPHIPMINAYGPTECSDDVTHYPIYEPPPADVVNMPIGRPVINMQMYILNPHLQPVPIGVAGELYVGGIGVGRGYLHDPERTKQAFMSPPSPLTPLLTPPASGQALGEGDPNSGNSGRLYKTGDLCRYLPDGNIEFLGRIDHQVKIRGFRIELGEIEAVLTQHPSVREVVVLAREDGVDKRLVAYLVSEEPVSNDELRVHLTQKLPDYMQPAAFVHLEAMPLTPNGKIDRRALPAPSEIESVREEELVLPRTPIEESLAAIWQEVLGLEEVGIHDNFFEVGGHSLLATQVITRSRQLFQVELPLRTLFEEPTVARLAARLEKIKVTQTIQQFVKPDPSASEESLAAREEIVI